MPDLSGFGPPIPGMTRGDGPLPGSKTSPMEMLAMMMGMNRQTPDSAVDKMAKVVQLLREVSVQDPRIAAIAGGALRALLEGPPVPRSPIPGQPPGSGPAAGGVIGPTTALPIGGPTG